jgi:hypothetical protein
MNPSTAPLYFSQKWNAEKNAHACRPLPRGSIGEPQRSAEALRLGCIWIESPLLVSMCAERARSVA